MEKMEKKFWWFSKKKDSAADFDEINNDYYGDSMSTTSTTTDGDYSDGDTSDVTVVLAGDPSKKEPLMKKTFTPESYEYSADIVDAFKEGRVVVICVEELDKPNFMRLFDYLMGAVQALDGELERVDRDTVVLYPYGVDPEETSIDELDEAEDEEDENEDDVEEDSADEAEDDTAEEEDADLE